jgi:Mitochondrial ribosomal protein (VAR1)
MYNNYKPETIKPLIFSKKIKDYYKIIPLKKISSILGPIRYFPPATQEWYDSIYNYNINYIKNIAVADKNLSKIIKSYFNLYFKNKFLSSKHMNSRFRRLAINKIFVSKAELKHTNSKITITLYLYNEERRILINRINRIETMLFDSIKNNSIKLNNNFSLKEKLKIIKSEQENVSFKTLLDGLRLSVFEAIKKRQDILMTVKPLKNEDGKDIRILKENMRDLLSIISACEKDPILYTYYNDIYEEFITKMLLEKELIIIVYYKLLLSLNKFKFEDKFLSSLKSLIGKIYNKEVEFNIINLKAIYLNSDIFTQIISFKLKNRNNGLLKVLRSFLYTVKLSKVNLIKERFNYTNPQNLWINLVKNLKVNYLYDNKYINKGDNLNNLLLVLLKRFNQYKKAKYYNKIEFNKSTLLSSVLNNLRYKSIGGLRLEAKGRLTKRFTASRSIFKIKWKGSLKNIDSSYRGLSSTMLRGYIKSNVQYSIINSKTRNGAFGLKGWISGK